MRPLDKKFWGPWTAGMVVAALMILVGGFVPTQSGAQAQAVTKVKKAEKVATAKVVEAARVAALKVLAEAKVAKLEVGVPASMAYVDVRALVATASQPSSQPAVVLAPVKPDDVQGVSNTIKGAMHTSNWRLVVLAGLLLAVLLLRKCGGWFLPAKAGAWVNSDRGGAALALLAGTLTVLVNGLIAGGKFEAQLLIDGVLAAFTTAGAFNVSKKLAKPSDLQATSAGPNAPTTT